MTYAQILAYAEVTKKSQHYATLYVTPKKRVTFLDGNNVSSISAKDTKKISDKLTKGSSCIMLLENGKQKVAKLDRVKPVVRNGVPVLKVWASSDEYDSTGDFSKSAVNLNGLVDGNYSLMFNVLNINSGQFSCGELLSPPGSNSVPILEPVSMGQYLRASEDPNSLGYFIIIETNQRVENTRYSYASWDENNFILRIWLRNNNRANWTLNTARIPRDIAQSRDPKVFTANNGLLFFQGQRPDWIQPSLNVSNPGGDNPCISNRNCCAMNL
jgi:hypothetical protein